MLLGKVRLDIIKTLFFKALTDSYFSYDQIVSVNNALTEYNEFKEEIKNPETSAEYIR